jgi:hypothetical protein
MMIVVAAVQSVPPRLHEALLFIEADRAGGHAVETHGLADTDAGQMPDVVFGHVLEPSGDAATL